MSTGFSGGALPPLENRGQPPLDWPPPEVKGRPATTEETPRNARALVAVARARGWTVTVAYARGTVPDRYWQPGPVVDSVALVARREGEVLAATWEDGRFRSAWLWPGPWPLGYRAIKGTLEGTEEAT